VPAVLSTARGRYLPTSRPVNNIYKVLFVRKLGPYENWATYCTCLFFPLTILFVQKFCPQKVNKLRYFTALYLKHVVRNFLVPFLKQNSKKDAQQRLGTTILQQMKTARFDFDELPQYLSLDALCD